MPKQNDVVMIVEMLRKNQAAMRALGLLEEAAETTALIRQGMEMLGETPCCYIDPESGEGCTARAELLIVSGHSPDDYTHACPIHVEDLFVDGPFNCVYPL